MFADTIDRRGLSVEG